MTKLALIVEDDRATSALIQKLLQNHGITSEIYEDVVPAIARLLAKKSAIPDLIITDIYLQNSNGIALLETIALSPNLRNIPRIAISSCFTSVNMATVTSYDCNEVCFKPINVSDLSKKVEMLTACPPLKKTEGDI